MGFFAGVGRFGKGGLIGAAIGAAAGILLAPGKGEETREAVAERIQRTRKAGIDARAEVERDLINRYRGVVQDSAALKAEQLASEEAHRTGIAHVEATKPEF